MDKQLIIGLGGTSRSGKSALAKKIMMYYQAQNYTVGLIHQDDLVKIENEIPRIKGRVDWEHPESMDFELQLNQIKEKSDSCQIVIVEGILAFYDERINQLFHLRIQCEIDKFNFLRRRRKETRWGLDQNWYIEHIWDSYHRYGRTILFHPNKEYAKQLIYVYNHSYENRVPELMKQIAQFEPKSI